MYEAHLGGILACEHMYSTLYVWTDGWNSYVNKYHNALNMKLFSFDILLLGFNCNMLYKDNYLINYILFFQFKTSLFKLYNKYISDVGWKICAAFINNWNYTILPMIRSGPCWSFIQEST